MKVFLAATSLLPAYGGPAFSVSALAHALSEAGVSVGVWAADGSAQTTDLLPAASSAVRLAGSEVEAFERFGRADVIHDNGLWLPHNHRLAALAASRRVPRVVSTRGMLEPWAMNHKRWKKALAWGVYQRRDLQRAQGLHATAEPEAANAERMRLSVPIATIPNGVDLGVARPLPTGRAEVAGPRTALFLGRIYPVKGLPMLVEAWGRVRPSGWSLQIGGPDEAGHRREVEQAIAAADLQADVSFIGALDSSAKSAALNASDLLVLPSYSESFGMAVAEGLAHGLPVLATTAVPWPGLEDRGCGWRVEPTVNGLAAGLRLATACMPAILRTMGERGRSYVATEFGWASIAHRFADLYEELVREFAAGPGVSQARFVKESAPQMSDATASGHEQQHR